MPSAVAGPEIERLIQLLARLPGLGPRSARRAALHLIKKREQLMSPLADAIETALEDPEPALTRAKSLRERIFQHFSQKAMVEGVLAGYGAAVSAKFMKSH